MSFSIFNKTRIMKNKKINTKKVERKAGISATVAIVVVVGILARKCTKDFEKTVTAEVQQRLLMIARLKAEDISNELLGEVVVP